MRLALYQPDIPPNTGTLLRLSACLDVSVDIIEPCGFPFDDRSFRRAGLDYLQHASFVRHLSWQTFVKEFRTRVEARLVLLTTKAKMSHIDFEFSPNDTLLLGRETAGVPDDVHAEADACVRIPMVPERRSLNVATAAAIVLGEALRQTEGYPVTARQCADGTQDER